MDKKKRLPKTNNDICKSIDVVAAKLELLTKFNEERISELKKDIQLLATEVHRLAHDHEIRIKALEQQNSYTRGVISLLLVLGGMFGSVIIRSLLGS